MRASSSLRGLIAAALLCAVVPALAIQLVPVVPSGLASPVFVGNAHDGSNRLFIVEQGGTIQVLQPGASTPTVFLDIRPKIVAGGEQGCSASRSIRSYAANGRFFVYYTRLGDGTLVIAEYRVSADPECRRHRRRPCC